MDESIPKARYEGKELKLDKELVNVGLSLFSVKKCKIDDSNDRGLIKAKNSHRNFHRPEVIKTRPGSQLRSTKSQEIFDD